MAAASSGDPGGSVNRRIPAFMDPTNSFGELTFLQLTAKEGFVLPKNPFIIGKSVEAWIGGPIESAKSEAQGTKYVLRVRNPAQVARLLTLQKLVDGTEIEIIAHPNLNISKCVISCFDLIETSEPDILREMIGEKVIHVHRITRNVDGKKINTPALILTFGKTTYPSHIKVGLLHVPTRPYFPNPMLCYGCFNYGHTAKRCPEPKRCYNCSEQSHVQEGGECDKSPLCRNCQGNHRPTNRKCPIYLKETEVIKIKVRDNVTYPEARKRVEQQTGGSYAQVAAQQSAFEKRLKELEAAMTLKDKEIAKLREESKKKDDRIEQMMAYIKQSKQQNKQRMFSNSSEASSQEKQNQSRDPRVATMPAGPSTRSRNNSPAIQEAKRGRPAKQINSKLAISPESSPPPKSKKPLAPTHDLTQMEFSDEESGTSDTPQKQPVR